MRKQPGLRALLCAPVCVPASCVCASFVPVACFSTVPLLRSHLAAPTRYCVGASCVRAGGGRAGLLWACLLAGGGVWCLRFLGVFAWVFAFLLVCARLGGGGTVWSRRPFTLTALWRRGLLVLTLWCGRCWRVRRSLGCGVTVMGRDNYVPPHTAWRGLPGCCVARKRGGWGCSHGVLTRARTRREMGEEGEPRGADRGGLGGGCGWWRVGW